MAIVGVGRRTPCSCVGLALDLCMPGVSSTWSRRRGDLLRSPGGLTGACGVLGPGSGRCGGCAQYIGGACTRGNAKKETHFSGWTACPAVNDAPDHAFCNPNAQHRPPLLSAMPCTAQVLPECKASASASRRRPSEARRDAAPPAAAPAAAAAAAADPGGWGRGVPLWLAGGGWVARV